MHMHPRHPGRALLIALALLLPTPAAAAPPERFTYVDAFTTTDFCGIDAVDITVDLEQRIRWQTKGSDGLLHFASNLRMTASWTNAATGATIWGEAGYNEKDLEVTDNGDGTLTILVQVTGPEKFFDADGRMVEKNPGLFRYEILIDHGGTPQDPSDDVFLEDLGVVKGSTGANYSDGMGFCDVMQRYIG